MSCDVGETTEELKNELWRRWSNLSVGEWAHSTTFPLLHLCHKHFTYITWRAAHGTLPCPSFIGHVNLHFNWVWVLRQFRKPCFANVKVLLMQFTFLQEVIIIDSWNFTIHVNYEIFDCDITRGFFYSWFE